MSIATSTVQEYTNRFGDPVVTVRSPGRVNIIGEHTDYNEGFVLPAAIDKACYVCVGKRDDKKINLYSIEFQELFESDINSLTPTEGWPNYVLGVADQFVKRGFEIGGFNLVLNGDVPIGAGLSSSAAVECATAFALNILYEVKLEKMQLAELAQKAEHTFPGVRCGIMDQFASVFGKADHVIKLDCRSLEYEYVPLNLKDYKILLLNTNVKHSLASSEYNNRRMECEKGVDLVSAHEAGVKSVRDITLDMLDKFVKPVDELIFRRCKYVIQENTRLLEGCDDLQNENIDGLGKKMFESHNGLSRDYEVSCRELDFLVDFVKENINVPGARMMGGGFGGCTINIVKEDYIGELIETISKAYTKSTGLELTSYVATTGNGTAIIRP